MFHIVKRPAPAKKTKGYDVYHRDSTRRVWVGYGRTKREAQDVVDAGKIPTRHR